MSLPRLNAVDSAEQWIVIGRSGVAVSCPVDATEDILAVIPVPANAMGPNGQLRIWTAWTITNSVNNKTFRVRFGGPAGTQYMAQLFTTSASVSWLTALANRGALNSQVAFGPAQNQIPSGGTANALTVSAVDTSQPTSVVISGQKATAGEVLTLEAYLVELLQGA